MSWMLTLVLGLGPVYAHHNKGLPHYGYFENYPQVPTQEYVVIDGRWEVGATLFNFQGLRDRTTSETPNDVKFYMYAYDLDADAGYSGPLQVRITHGGETVALLERLEPDGEGVYISRETLPRSGDYDLVYVIGGDEIALPFSVDLEADRVAWGLLLGLGAGLGGLFVLALMGRERRLVRRAAAPAGA